MQMKCKDSSAQGGFIMTRLTILTLTILLTSVLGLCSTAPARQAQTDRLRMIPASTGLHSGTVRHVSPEILGRISGGSDGNLLHGRKIRVLLRKGGRTIFSQVKALDATGSCSYRFLPMTTGTYTVHVEKVASGPAMASRSNVCFIGTQPTTRTVTLSSGALRATGLDFIIRFNIAWNRHGPCW
jgi:hypothetical protein